MGSIPTPGINQSSRGEPGKCSSPVCLSIRLVRACYGLSVGGLWLVAIVSRLVVDKIKVRSGSSSKQAGMHYVTIQHFFTLFSGFLSLTPDFCNRP